MYLKIISSIFFLPCVAFAAANIAKLPIKLTQEYADGVRTEFRCSSQKNWELAPTCFFKIIDKNKSKEFSIDTDIRGYILNFYYSPWNYHFYGELKGKHFNIVMDVECSEEDANFVGKIKNPTCQIFFSESKGKLTANEVAITFFDGQDFQTKTRQFSYKN